MIATRSAGDERVDEFLYDDDTTGGTMTTERPDDRPEACCAIFWRVVWKIGEEEEQACGLTSDKFC